MLKVKASVSMVTEGINGPLTSAVRSLRPQTISFGVLSNECYNI